MKYKVRHYAAFLATALIITYSLSTNLKTTFAAADEGTCSFPSMLGGTSFASADFPRFLAKDDVNHDGRMDVVTSNYFSGSLSVFLGDGAGGFGAAIDSPVGDHPMRHVLGDLNGDGLLDSIVVRPVSNQFSVLMGDGTGHFSAFQNHSITEPFVIQLAYIDNDSVLDILMTAGSGFTGRSEVYLGIGDGTFRAPIIADLGRPALAVVMGDFNSDEITDFIGGSTSAIQVWLGDGNGSFSLGWTTNNHFGGPMAKGNFNGDPIEDLVVTTIEGERWPRILFGNGDGTFREGATYDIGTAAPGLAVDDVTGDGLDDIIGSNFATSEISVLASRGGGQFQHVGNYLSSVRSGDIVIHDFSGDGKLDVVTISYSPFATRDGGKSLVMLTRGRGDGTFMSGKSYRIFENAFPNSAATADLNGDGRDDVVTANSTDWGISVFLRNGDFSFAPPRNFLQQHGIWFVAIADLDRDGKLDLAAGGGSAVKILKGDGHGGFSELSSITLGEGNAFALYVGAADFNGDNILDLVVSNQQYRMNVAMGIGNGVFHDPVEYLINATPSRIAIGDYNRDGKPDLAIVLDDGIFPKVQVRLNNGIGNFSSSTDYIIGQQIHPTSIATADFDNDGFLDFAVVTKSDPTDPIQLRTWKGGANGAFEPSFAYPVQGDHPYDIVAKDLNADGKVDLATANYLSMDVSVFAGSGDGRFSYADSVPGEAPQMLLTGNFNADSSPDLLMVHRSNTFTVVPNTCNQLTESQGILFDYDGDGRTDISVYRPSAGNWYLQRSRDGFSGVNLGIFSDRIVPADYDGDGKTDIAVYRPSTGIWYVTNSSTGAVTYNLFGIAEDLPTPADYDGDGKADISVFRPSTGTWYRKNSSNGAFVAAQFGATGDKPTVGDFDGDGKADIAVFRPSTGAWYQTWSSNGFLFGEQFGISTDKITQADYDGDGKTDIAIYRPSEGLWYVKRSATTTYVPYVFGLAADIPVPGDFDGDGKADIGVFRPSDGTWYIVNSSNGSYTIYQFGQNGDLPTLSGLNY